MGELAVTTGGPGGPAGPEESGSDVSPPDPLDPVQIRLSRGEPGSVTSPLPDDANNNGLDLHSTSPAEDPCLASNVPSPRTEGWCGCSASRIEGNLRLRKVKDL
ncbi:unnamed protein product [Coregonus sp. 'balchen']|nr:unnamed protein product [Coregonus sp. 'balchen']